MQILHMPKWAASLLSPSPPDSTREEVEMQPIEREPTPEPEDPVRRPNQDTIDLSDLIQSIAQSIISCR